MESNQYHLPNPILDYKERRSLELLTEQYQKMMTPSMVGKAVEAMEHLVPNPVKKAGKQFQQAMTQQELYKKSMDILANGFQKVEQIAAKATLSEDAIIAKVNKIDSFNEITALEEICLTRGYHLSKIVGKNKMSDFCVALVEGAATGAPGFAGLPFNLVLSTFIFYRAVQSIALFYGFDVKNDFTELEIAGEVFANAMRPGSYSSDSELSSVIAKIMLLAETTTVKQTVQKSWTAMAEKDAITLLLTQMRALANRAAKKALDNAGKNSLEYGIFSNVMKQMGKKLTKKSIERSIPFVGAFIGATMDAAQMNRILKYANIFYHKRFLLEKEEHIRELTVSHCNVSLDESHVCIADATQIV